MKLLNLVHDYDVKLFFNLINSRFYHSFTTLARVISQSANGQLYLVLVIFLYFTEGLQSPFLKTLLVAFTIERPLYFVLKNSFRRDRPQAALKDYQSLLTPSDQFSFPSGHTSAAFMVAGIMSFYLPLLSAPLLLWAFLVGVSRVILGVHFPTDTLIGMILGVTVSIYSLVQIT